MKASELRQMSEAELKEKLEDLRKEILNIRFQAAAGKQASPKRTGILKKDVARVLTLFKENQQKNEKS